MTSPRFNADRLRAKAEREMTIFDQLPSTLREILRDHEVRSSVILNALLRGVSEQQIIETLNRSRANAKNSDNA